MAARMALLAAMAVLLMLGAASAQQEQVTVLRGSGDNETATWVLKVLQVVEERAGKPVDFIYRDLPVATSSSTSTEPAIAQSDFVNYPTKVDFGVGWQPLSNANWTSLGAGNVMQIPLGMFTVSVFYNIPSSPSSALNLTACMVQKLLTGAITTWNPSITSSNAALAIQDQTIKVNVFYEAGNSASTQMIMSFLAATTCPIASVTSITATPSADIAMSVMTTTYSIGFMLTSRGNALGLKEAAVQNANMEYVTSSTQNLTNTQAAVAAAMPSSFTADFSAVSTTNLPGSKVFPITAVSYMYLRTNQASTGDKGALLQATATYMMTPEAQGYCTALGILPVSSSLATAATTALSTGITLNSTVTPYTIEPAGTVSATGYDTQSISATRAAYYYNQLADLKAQLDAVKATIAQSSPKLLRGSGSSAVSLVVWRAMDTLNAQATTPIWTSYRAIGSGGGESEIVGRPAGSAPAVDFACSDVPMTRPSYIALANLNIKVLHVPMHIAPISIFVNIPTSVLPKQDLRLSACTIAGIFQGLIQTWADPAIAADNNGLTLPPQQILPAYRYTASGTNAVFSQYFATACNSGPFAWALGSGKVLPVPGSTGTFSTKATAVGASADMTSFIAKNQWSIGYSDTANGVQVGLTEVLLKNKAGTWLTAQVADLPAAASQLFQSGGWPANPTDDFSGVSLLDQAGTKTWPIISIPFTMLRLDVTSRASSGQLLAAYLSYLLSTSAQSQLPLLGFAPLSSDVLTYTVQRVLPLLLVDTRYPAWYFEGSGGSAFNGAGDAVLSATKDTYTHVAATQYMVQSLTASAAATAAAQNGNNNNTFNISSLNLTSIAGLTGLGGRIDEDEKKIAILQSIAIVSLIFAMAALCLGIFAACKMFIIGTLGGRGQVAAGSGHPRGSMSGASNGDASNRSGKGEDMNVSLMTGPGPAKV